MHTYLLAHDLGTSGNKAVLFDTVAQKITASIVEPYQVHYLDNGGVEQEADAWWNAICKSTRALLENASISPQQIQAVSFSALMNSCLPVDAQGEPLRSAMIWCDQRSLSAVEKIRARVCDDEFYYRTGHILNQTYALPKMLWFKDNEPELYARTSLFLQAKDYIAFKLTGRFATDYSDTSHLGVMDQEKKRYWDELLQEMQLSCDKLPELHISTDVIGHVTAQAARLTGLAQGTPVVMGGGDGCCANAGAGLYKPGSAYSILGTSAWHGTLSEAMLHGKNNVTTSFIHLDGVHYAALGVMQSGGHSLNWLLELLNAGTFEAHKSEIFARVNLAIQKKIEDKQLQPLLYLPYLLGERSPWWNMNARGCFIGLDSSSTPEDAVLACMEGVGFNLKIILDSMEGKLGDLDMRLIGGGARNRQWAQILASIWNKPLSIPKYLTEATSLGAILCAGIGVGAFKDFSVIERINPALEQIAPNADLQERYAKLYPAFQKAYLALVDVFEDLHKIH